MERVEHPSVGVVVIPQRQSAATSPIDVDIRMEKEEPRSVGSHHRGQDGLVEL